MEAGKIEEKDVSVGEDALTEEEQEVEHEFIESLSIINFASCTNDELIEFMFDFFNLTDEKVLLHFFVIYFTAVAAEAEEKAAEIVEETAWMWEMDQEEND